MKIETLKKYLALEIRYYRLAQYYEIALDEPGREAHLRAARRKQREARRKYRNLIKSEKPS